MGSLLELIRSFWNNLQTGQATHLGGWSYVLLWLVVIVEGPVATLLGAAAASAGFMRLGLVFVTAILGNFTADVLWYLLGYAGKLEWLLRYGRWLGVRRHHLERLQQSMREHAFKIMLSVKLTNAFTIPSLIAAGLARIPWKRWIPAFLIGQCIWTGTLVLIGYYAAESIKQVQEDIRYGVLVASLLFLLVILWLARRTLRKREESDGSVGDDEG
jgi:membrane protein DedA with SNARE-associated domain